MAPPDQGTGEAGFVARDSLVEPALGPGPGVLVIHSGRGRTKFVDSACKRLARHGFVALAVDLFRGTRPETIEEAQAAKESVDEEATKRVLEDAVTLLLDHESVSRPQIGVIGLGYGAEWGCWLASNSPHEVGALVLFYGYRDVQWERVEAPVLGHFSELDREFPPSRVQDIREQMLAADVETDFFVYQGEEPSFFEDEDSARYSPRAARLAWDRTTTFLDRTLRNLE